MNIHVGIKLRVPGGDTRENGIVLLKRSFVAKCTCRLIK